MGGGPDTGLPIHFHIGNAGDTLEGAAGPERYANHGVAGAQAYTAVNLFMKNGVQCSDLITLTGADALSRAEGSCRSRAASDGCRSCSRRPTTAGSGPSGPAVERQPGDVLPSDLFRQSVYVTYWFESIAPKHFLDVVLVEERWREHTAGSTIS